MADIARYGLVLPQNLAPTGVEFTEKQLVVSRGCLFSASKDTNREIAVLPVGTNGQILAVDANGDLVWVTPSSGHTQGTDTGTTGSTFDIDSDGTTNGVRLKTSSGSLLLRNLADSADADLTVKDITISGNLTVNGTTTTINATTITVDDKNIELGSVASPTDTTADGGGITIKGTTDKTLIWDSANGNWTANQNFNIPTGKVYKINNVQLNQDNFADGTTNKAYTATEKTKLSGIEASAASLATVKADTDVASAILLKHAAVTIGTANGLSLSTQALSMALASTSVTGALSSTDWNTFNGKKANWVTAPAAKNSAGTAGQMAYENNYLYICVATSKWGRTIIADEWTK